MPVFPRTHLSLIAATGLHRLRQAFEDLSEIHDFYVDSGSWCCKTCAGKSAWSEGRSKKFVFWHEGDENSLHQNPHEALPLCYGLAIENSADESVREVAHEIIEILEEHDLPFSWSGDTKDNILVRLDSHQPTPLDPEDEYAGDYLDVNLYLPKNEETEEYCVNPGNEDLGDPMTSYYFCHKIEDGESLAEAVLRVKPEVRKYISHFNRAFNKDGDAYDLESVISIETRFGHNGTEESLIESIEVC